MIKIHPQISHALQNNIPVVALESTVIAHGLPYPDNLNVAKKLQNIVQQNGAVPATIAILDGQVKVGLDDSELKFIAENKIAKVSLKDISLIVAEKGNGATTVAATVWASHQAGIQVFATGGIGGIHPGEEMDCSSDLPALATIPVAVICSGPKAILDLRKTREWFETWGIPILGYQTPVLPAFYCSKTNIPIDRQVNNLFDMANLVHTHLTLMERGVLVAVPVPKDKEISLEEFNVLCQDALKEAQKQGIQGGHLTPFLMEFLRKTTSNATLKANISLLENNALVATQLAVELAKKKNS